MLALVTPQKTSGTSRVGAEGYQGLCSRHRAERACHLSNLLARVGRHPVMPLLPARKPRLREARVLPKATHGGGCPGAGTAPRICQTP